MSTEEPNPGSLAEAAVPGVAPAEDDSVLEPRPYLRIFGPDTGVSEVYLTNDTITIGRSDHADIQLRHHTVSRIHATVALCDGEYVIEDADSNFGVLVNSRRVERSPLRHGDTIQISLYVVQFRTHPAPPGAAAAAARAKFLLRSDFCMLPSTMRLRLRSLHVEPREIFRRGDTLRVGHGGLLVPTDSAWDDTSCLELELCWPTGQTKRYLGEVLGLIEEGSLHWGCVKLHIVPREIHDATVEAGEPGPWVEVTAT